MRDYSSGSDSDEYDTANIISFQRNMARVTNLVQDFVPQLKPENFVSSAPPAMRMNKPYVIDASLSDASVDGSPLSFASQEGYSCDADESEGSKRPRESQTTQGSQKTQESEVSRMSVSPDVASDAATCSTSHQSGAQGPTAEVSAVVQPEAVERSGRLEIPS